MANYIYSCPVCNNLIKLAVDLASCPFDRGLIGQCEKCNLKIDIREEDYEEWVKEKEQGFYPNRVGGVDEIMD